MLRLLEIKKEFLKERENLFASFNGKSDAFEFSKNYSLLLEDTIRIIIGDKKISFALASAGSFSRRELSPYSDIDLMIISDSIEKDDEEIKALVTNLWDGGIEASHTVRETSDIQKSIEYADRIISASQPGGSVFDLPALQRSEKGAVRFFSMFMSFIIKHSNR